MDPCAQPGKPTSDHAEPDSLAFLAETAVRLISSEIRSHIYAYIAECLHRLNPASIVFIHSVDQENQIIRDEAYIEPDEIPEMLKPFTEVGRNGRIFSYNDDIKPLFETSIQKITGGITETIVLMLLHQKHHCPLAAIYGISFRVGARIYALAIQILPEGKSLRQIGTINTFLINAAVTLKRIEAEKTEEKYRSMFENMSQGAFYQGPDFRFIDANAAALDILGVDREELLQIDPVTASWDALDENMQPIPLDRLPSREAFQTRKTIQNKVIALYNKRIRDYKWLIINSIPQTYPDNDIPFRVLVTIQDITEQKQMERIMAARLRILEQSGKLTLHELLVATLNEAEIISRSEISFYHFLENDGKTISLQAWSANTVEHMCKASPDSMHYPVDQAGIWVDCLKERKPVIHNRYDSEPHRKGFPEGHALLSRELIVPVVRDNQVVAILGVGNKKLDYHQPDVVAISTLADLAWEIVEKKRAEESLRAKDAQARALLEAIPDLMFRLDASGVYLDYKVPPGELYYQEADIVGLNTRDITPPEFNIVLQKNMKLALKTGRMQEFEYCLPIPGMGVQDYEARMVPSSPTEIVAIVRNITARKQTERTIAEANANARAIMEATADVIILIDQHMRVIDTNESHASRFGLTRQEMIGKTIDQFLPTEIAARRAGWVNQVLQSGEPVLAEDERNGRWSKFAIYPVKNVNGIADRVAVFSEDITEQRLYETNLARSEARLKELNATKDKFFSIMAHDLKSPFNSIVGLTEILAEQVKEKDFENIEKIGELIVGSSHRALDLLTNLLEWSRAQTGTIPFEPGFQEFVSLIDDSLELASAQASLKSIRIEKHLPPASLVYCDKSMIGTILRNLISNALKYTHPGGQIQISLSEEKDQVIISVSDTGIGIEPDRMTTLFHIGETFSTPGTHNEKGTGLGLILCREFIEKHHGKIWAESEPEKGSVFRFSLPVVNI